MKNLKELLDQVGSTAEFNFSEIVDVNAHSGFGDTPLHVVCRWGDVKAVETLIAAGADVNAIGETQRTPLFAAVLGEVAKIVEILLRAGADPLAKDQNGRFALEVAELLQDSSIPDSAEIIAVLRAATCSASGS